MTALASLSDLINRACGGNSGSPENIFVYKDNRSPVATIAGRMTSLWTYDGVPALGAAPGAVAIPDNTTAGGVKQTDPGGGREKWLVGVSAASLAAGTLILYDRLLHISGLSGTTASPTAQTVGGTLTRNTGGVGNEIWVEIYTQIGATSTTITASYTDDGGNSGQTSVATAIGNTGFREAQRIIRLPLASGDTGVQAVASVTLAASTTTAGNFGVTIARPLLAIPIPVVGSGVLRNLLVEPGGPIKIDADACLAWAWLANGTTAPQLHASLHMVEA